MPIELTWLVILVTGAILAGGLMVWLSREFRRRGLGTGEVAGEVRILGAYSPLLTWLKAHFPAHLPVAKVPLAAAPASIPFETWPLGAACVLAVLGQWILFSNAMSLLTGLLFYLVAIILFIWVCHRL